MTEVETILKMLEDAESDNDEVNARIWCFEHNYRLLNFNPDSPMVDYDGVCVTYPYSVYHYHKIELPKYTTSFNAAMSIGAEELEGFLVRNHQLKNGEYEYWLQEKDGPWHTSILHTKDLPRAIACACLQALEYVRGL